MGEYESRYDKFKSLNSPRERCKRITCLITMDSPST